MKKTLLLLLFLFAGMMQAQIVNIPDPAFKQYLLNYQDDVFYPENQVIDMNQDGEIQLNEAQAIEILSIINIYGNAPILSLEGIEAFTNVTTIQLVATMESVDLSDLTNLSWLYITGPALQNLSLPNTLTHLNLSMSSLTALDVSDQNNLTFLQLSEVDHLTSLIIGANTSLNIVTISSASLQSVDLRECPNVNSINLGFNVTSHDVYVNLKNGNAAYTSPPSVYTYSFEENGHKCFVCIDEGEREQFQETLPPAIHMSSYCTFTPGGDYNVITGSLLFDNEGDGCDTNDTVISNIKVDINNATQSGSSFSNLGLYNFYTQEGTFTITPDFENDHFTITPPFAEISFTEVDSLVTTQNFCLTPNGNHPDLDIVIVPFGARPGFDADYKIIYRNKGNQTLSGDIVFAYQEDELDFVSANPPQDTSALGTLTWNYIGLAPFEQREIFVTLNVNGPMETPAVNIDDNLQFTATINPVTGDDTPLDNVFGIKETVIGSFDPNDITCLEGRSVSPEMIGEYLHYNINFENTGTAPATFVVIKNVIDTSEFDITSFGMLGASHPVNATITGNKVEFYFNNINLGPLGKGNVVFRIKTLNTLQANDDVTQQANIYFDYNWPIQTNDATTVFEVLNSGEFERDYSIKVYPNPSDGIVNISAASEIKSFELYDVQGRLLQAGTNASFDTSGRAAGMYFVRVFTEEGMKVEKVFKK